MKALASNDTGKRSFELQKLQQTTKSSRIKALCIWNIRSEKANDLSVIPVVSEIPLAKDLTDDISFITILSQVDPLFPLKVQLSSSHAIFSDGERTITLYKKYSGRDVLTSDNELHRVFKTKNNRRFLLSTGGESLVAINIED
ncbi:MAG: hypothetical protein HKN87_02775 [Saprospiraceae bacterium]|nr:hypothetical protein [Saprospiraceae bacterium]